MASSATSKSYDCVNAPTARIRNNSSRHNQWNNTMTAPHDCERDNCCSRFIAGRVALRGAPKPPKQTTLQHTNAVFGATLPGRPNQHGGTNTPAEPLIYIPPYDINQAVGTPTATPQQYCIFVGKPSRNHTPPREASNTPPHEWFLAMSRHYCSATRTTREKRDADG